MLSWWYAKPAIKPSEENAIIDTLKNYRKNDMNAKLDREYTKWQKLLMFDQPFTIL